MQKETVMATKTESTKLLVICVDRDNDVGEKTGLETPVVGRNACIEAAQKLALEDPEDADSNAIFSAIKTYEDLISRGYEAQVIIVTGVERRGVQADEKIASEIKLVLKTYNAGGAVIVSDGEDDESVIPAIQNILPVVSVQRVVMKVSRTVEYSYAVFAKYVKMLAYDSKYSKFFLGVPGILLLIGGIATIFGYTAEIFAMLVSILGAAFVIRAFDIDKAWASWTKPSPSGFLRLFTVVAGITDSSSSPSDTITAPPALYVLRTNFISEAIFSSACTPLRSTPVTMITCASYPLLIKSSYVFIAENIAFESASSGSSSANFCAASMHALRPTTGVSSPVFSPTSLSLSTHMTKSLVDSVFVAITVSFCIIVIRRIAF